MKKFWNVAMHVIGYATIASLVITGVTVLIWLNPRTPIEFHDKLYQTNKLVYEQGEVAFYKVDYCKFTDIQPTVRKWYIDGLQLEAEEHEPVLFQGCREQIVEFRIPTSLPADEWHLRVDSTYQLNPLKTWKTTNITNDFQVTSAHTDLLDDIKAMEEARQ